MPSREHLGAVTQQRLDHGLLLRGEVGKPVDIHARRVETAVRDLLCEHREPVGGVGGALRGHGVKGRAEQREIRELLSQIPAAFGGGFLKRFGRHAGELQLVHGGEQRLLHLGAARGGGEDLQPRRDLAHGPRHAQQPPALVERHGGAAAHLGGDLPREAREAQHLGIERRAVAADAPQLPLGLVAVLLGHDQKLPRPLFQHRRADLMHQRRGLAGARRAVSDSKHRAPSSDSFRSAFIALNEKVKVR